MLNKFFKQYGLPIILLLTFVLAGGSSVFAEGKDQTGMPENMPQMEMSWPTGDSGGMGMMMHHNEKPKTFGGRLIAWLGAWHPAVIHFPIALTLTVAFLELAAFFRRKPSYSVNNKMLLALATLGAFAAAVLGWADMGMPTPDNGWTQTTHRWLGTTIPFLLLLLWYLKTPAGRSKAYSALLAVMVVVILFQAYMGGEITHGANHMAF